MIRGMRVVRWMGQQGMIETVYQSQDVKERIRAFKDMDLTGAINGNLPKIHNPSFLREMNAKAINDYVQSKQIGKNVRIMHALAHIEYNAFMSYADTIFRFSHTLEDPSFFIADMRKVTLQEASHFQMLQNRLIELGHGYGALPVIPRLSNAISQTQGSILERIAVMSLVHEGRGVKSVRKLLGQLDSLGDGKTAEIVRVIQREEEGHYDYGWKWFLRVCQQQGKQYEEQLNSLNERFKASLKLPENYQEKYLL